MPIKFKFMQNKPSQVKLITSVILAMVCFSLSFVWFKEAYLGYGPLTTVFFRLTISVLILFPYVKLSNKLILPSKKDFKYLLLLAFFEPFLYFMGESYGLKYISSTVASVIIATIPLFAPITAFLFYREKLKWSAVLGIVVSFIGVSLVVLGPNMELNASPLGILLEFGAVLSAIAYTIILKKISTNMNNLSIILIQNFIGAIYFLPFWLGFEFKSFMAAPYHPEAIWAIVKLSVFASTLAFIFFTYSVRHMGVAKSNMFVNAIPVFTAIFAWMILDEILTGQKLLGIVIVITGLFVAQIKKRKKKKKGQSPIPKT